MDDSITSTSAGKSKSSSPLVSFSKPPSPVLLKAHARSRILKIKRDETSAVDDEVAHERYMQASQKVSLSFGDIFIDNNSTEVRKRANSCVEPISVLTSVPTIPLNSSSSPKLSLEGNSSSLQKQCYSPSTNQIVENNLPYSPSPTPSPTRHRILRSCSPRTLLSRPSSIGNIGQGSISGLKRPRPEALSAGGSPYQYESDSESVSSVSSTGIQTTASSSSTQVSCNSTFRNSLFAAKKPKLARNCPSPLTKVSTTPTEGLVITTFNNFPTNELSYQDIMEFENDSGSNVATNANFMKPPTIIKNGFDKFKAGNMNMAKNFVEERIGTSEFMKPTSPSIVNNRDKEVTSENGVVNSSDLQHTITFCDNENQKNTSSNDVNDIYRNFNTDGNADSTSDFSFQNNLKDTVSSTNTRI
ncbi:Hypothetical protein SRAE_2000419400 [Strongyloides ratti]|uniref:Uncharacterized protein n=1 Tax=Strongyloides ratti TaxID=34506 RepID=A0A090LI98_STRRB|nr:Hypothetical protein SRAE_2000419400 [Strongyloides ratti]CEF69546.1 Hypothetical protein SRAE_2000419400 [Strongyloides ratti]